MRGGEGRLSSLSPIAYLLSSNSPTQGLSLMGDCPRLSPIAYLPSPCLIADLSEAAS